MKEWRPLVGPELRAQCLKVAEEVAAALVADPPADGRLASGAAGCALLHAYLEEAFPGRGHGEHAVASLDRAIESVATEAYDGGLFTGLSGIAWVAEHVQPWLVDPGEDDANEQVDEALLAMTADYAVSRKLDLIAGIVGVGVYARAREGRGRSAALLDQILRVLEERMIHDGAGLTWAGDLALLDDAPGVASIERYFDLGLAHGVPGMISFLAGVEEGGELGARAETLLAGAMKWQLAQRLPPNSGGAFAYYAAPIGDDRLARNAWCRGDAGAAIALVAGALRLGDLTLEAATLDIARNAAARLDAASGVVDAGVCHGSAGLALINARLFQATGEPAFAGAAEHWVARTLALREPNAGFSGYCRVNGREREPASGLLFGATGVALTLLACATEHAPRWDAVFLPTLRRASAP